MRATPVSMDAFVTGSGRSQRLPTSVNNMGGSPRRSPIITAKSSSSVVPAEKATVGSGPAHELTRAVARVFEQFGALGADQPRSGAQALDEAD